MSSLNPQIVASLASNPEALQAYINGITQGKFPADTPPQTPKKGNGKKAGKKADGKKANGKKAKKEKSPPPAKEEETVKEAEERIAGVITPKNVSKKALQGVVEELHDGEGPEYERLLKLDRASLREHLLYIMGLEGGQDHLPEEEEEEVLSPSGKVGVEKSQSPKKGFDEFFFYLDAEKPRTDFIIVAWVNESRDEYCAEDGGAYFWVQDVKAGSERWKKIRDRARVFAEIMAKDKCPDGFECVAVMK